MSLGWGLTDSMATKVKWLKTQLIKSILLEALVLEVLPLLRAINQWEALVQTQEARLGSQLTAVDYMASSQAMEEFQDMALFSIAHHLMSTDLSLFALKISTIFSIRSREKMKMTATVSIFRSSLITEINNGYWIALLNQTLT